MLMEQRMTAYGGMVEKGLGTLKKKSTKTLRESVAISFSHRSRLLSRATRA